MRKEIPNPGNGNVLDAAESAFRLLVDGPAPLALDGAQLGHGLPPRLIILDELRSILLHPSASRAAREAVWRELISHSRCEGAQWVMGCAGVALPGLRKMVAALAGGEWAREADDIASEAVMAFVQALAVIDLDEPRIYPRLFWRVRKAAERARFAQSGPVPIPPGTAVSLAPPAPWGHPDLVLAEAARQGLISRRDVHVIGATRLEGIPLADVAAGLGLHYDTVRKLRRAAEKKVAAAIRDGSLHGQICAATPESGL